MTKQTLATAVISLMIAGCAQSRPDRPGDGPVGLVPVPSIHETINRSGNQSVAKATLPDPANPNWSGHPLAPGRPSTGLAPRMASSNEPPTRTNGEPSQTRWSEPPQELARDVATRRASTAPHEAGAQSPFRNNDQLVELPGINELQDVDGPTPAPEFDDELDEPWSGVSPAPAPFRAPVENEDDGDPLLGPNPSLMPDFELDDQDEPGTPSPSPRPSLSPNQGSTDDDEDPLLGPNPDLMPAFDLAEPGERVKPSPAPTPVDEPESELVPAPAPSTSALPTSGKVDASVQQASALSATPTADRAPSPNRREAGRAAARVGDDVITLRELITAVSQTVQKHGGTTANLSADEQNMIAKHVLSAMIERSLLVQAAKRQLKNDDKMITKLVDAADKYWMDNELAPLLHQNQAEDENQLKRKFEEQGRSYTELRQNFRLEFLAHIYENQKLAGKTEVGLPEMLAYYNAHAKDQANVRSAAVIWREILVEKSRHPSSEEARRLIDGLRERLRQGEDFAAIAASDSEGPAKIKAAGGLMETVPGNYIVASVNQALDALPIGEVSDVIEGPASYHIIRVESRRPSGLASFQELQDSIRKTLQNKKREEARRALLDDLRQKTYITTIFDNTASDPRDVRP